MPIPQKQIQKPNNGAIPKKQIQKPNNGAPEAKNSCAIQLLFCDALMHSVL